jgi:hypothetical protein
MQLDVLCRPTIRAAAFRPEYISTPRHWVFLTKTRTIDVPMPSSAMQMPNRYASTFQVRHVIG